MVLRLGPHSQPQLLNLRLLGQTQMQHLCLVRPTHLSLERLLTLHQVEDFSLEGPVRLAPRTLAQVCSPSVLVQLLLPRRPLLRSPLSPERPLEDSISLKPQHLTSGQINPSRLLADKRSQGAESRQRCGGGSRALWTLGGSRLD